MPVSTFLRNAFNSRRADFVCAAVAVLNKSLIAWLYASLKGDKALYLLFTQSFLQTGVMGEPVNVFETGRQLYLYNPAVSSPLYVLLCAPVLGLTHSYFIAQYAVSVAGLVLLFTALRQTALLFLKQRWQANFFVLCAGFFLYPFELSSPVKDVLAAGFSLWGVVLLYRFYSERPTGLRTTLLALCIGCVCLVKLLYIPVGMMLLILLAVFLLRKKSKAHLLHAGLCAGLLVLMGGLVMRTVLGPARDLLSLHNVAMPGDGPNFVPGFFPRNLLLTSPFLTASIFNVNFWGVQAERLTQVAYLNTFRCFQAADAGLLLFFAGAGLGYYKKIWRDKLLFQLVNVSLAVTAAVFYLSLSQKALPQPSSAYQWAYVSDVRSFFLPMLTLQLLLMRAVFSFRKALWMRRTLLFLFLFECLHGLYFTAKELITSPLSPEANESTDGVKKLTVFAQQSAAEGRPFALVTSDRPLRRYFDVHLLPAYSFTNGPADLSWVKKGETFVIATHRADSNLLKKFPAGRLVPADTMEPFVVHFYEQR